MKVLSVYIPIRIPTDQLPGCIEAYERLLGEACALRFDYPAAGVEIAAVGSVVLIAGAFSALEAAPASRGILAVDSLEEWRPALLNMGATIVRETTDTPTGRNIFARTREGTIFEVMQFDEKKATAANKVRP
jgi:hypothetical protein